MQKNLKLLGVIAILGASIALSGFAVQNVMATGANKTVYTTTATEVTSESEGEETLASAIIKTAKPTDVLVLYNEECALYTEVGLKSSKSTTGTPGVEIDTARAAHNIKLYVDGVQVGNDITMCDRTYGIHTNMLNQIQDLCSAINDIDGTTTCSETFLNTWIDTNSAHGWNWIVLNLGQDYDADGSHTIEVKGTYIDEDDTDNVENENEAVVIGQRSLIVIPTHLDVDAQ